MKLIYTWNPDDPCFGWNRPCFVGLAFKNRSHLGSRYLYKQFFVSKKATGNILEEFDDISRQNQIVAIFC